MSRGLVPTITYCNLLVEGAGQAEIQIRGVAMGHAPRLGPAMPAPWAGYNGVEWSGGDRN